MEILFVVLSPIKGNTSGIISNIGLINGMMDLGHRITILSVKEYGDNVVNQKSLFTDENFEVIYLEAGDLYKKVVDQRNQKISKSKKRVLGLLRKVYYKFKIMDNMMSVANNIDIGALKRKEYDVVISASDPKSSHIAMRNLIKQGLKYNKWIEYWGDPLALDITNHNIYPLFVNKIVENNLIKHADKICYVSPLTCNNQKKHFRSNADKMFFLPLPYDKERITLSTYDEKILKIGYFGDYSSNVRNILPLYNVCKKNKDIFLTIAGSSDIELSSCENVKIMPRISKNEVEILENECDVLVCVLNKSGTQIPGKIYYAAATNKAILVVLDGENSNIIEEFLRQYDRYIVCRNSENDIENALFQMKKKWRNYMPLKEFSPREIASKLIEESGLKVE